MSPKKDAIHIYLRDIGTIPFLTREEEKELVKRAKKGDVEAKKRLIKAHLRLVVSIAKRYMHFGVTFLDLIEEGNIGLMKAIEKYNPRKGARVSTYAIWWIKQAIIRSLANQGKTVRIPVYMVERILKIEKARYSLRTKKKKEPTLKEIAKYLKMPVKKIKEAEDVNRRFSSLHAIIDDEDTAELIEIIENIETLPPSQIVSSEMLAQDILDLLEVLNEREADIISKRFGLKGNKPMTLEEIGKEYKITRERVRQIESNAIKKMKKFLRQQKKDLLSYWTS